MKLKVATAGVAITVAGFGLVACGDDSASSSEPARLTVTASEPSEGKYAFDLPGELEGGTVTITLNNTGAEGHELGFARVADGTTAQQFADEVLASEEGAPLPDLLLNAPGGIGGVGPGLTRTGTIQLEEGTYVYFCTFGDETPHYEAGMLGELKVSGTASTAALPETTGTITASEYTFDTEGLTSGDQTLVFKNDGEQFHHLIAAKMADGATFDEVTAFITAEGEGADGPPPIDFENAQDLAVIGPGTSQTVTLSLEDGSYAFFCFLSDKAGGEPHVAKGMLKQIDIG